MGMISCSSDSNAKREFKGLLHGHGEIEISALTIAVGGLPVLIDDRESVQYLTIAVRRASCKEFSLGASYYATVTLSSGGSVKCGLYFPVDKKTITVGFPVDGPGNMEYYGIMLTDPLPGRVANVLTRLAV
jgi:hypothetical protein